MIPAEFEFPDRYLVVRSRIVDDTYSSFYADALQFEELHHAFERWLLLREDQVLAIRRLSGEVVHIPASSLIGISEQTQAQFALDCAINAQVLLLERETKRAIIGPDYDPDRD